MVRPFGNTEVVGLPVLARAGAKPLSQGKMLARAALFAVK